MEGLQYRKHRIPGPLPRSTDRNRRLRSVFRQASGVRFRTELQKSAAAGRRGRWAFCSSLSVQPTGGAHQGASGDVKAFPLIPFKVADPDCGASRKSEFSSAHRPLHRRTSSLSFSSMAALSSAVHHVISNVSSMHHIRLSDARQRSPPSIHSPPKMGRKLLPCRFQARHHAEATNLY
ncbi:hypothetical protein V6N13_052811 [Hibiscus sabdariffa]